MNNCIVCGKEISNIEKELNMDFHSKCAKNIIKEALKLLEEKND
jgi:hypothetical protein